MIGFSTSDPVYNVDSYVGLELPVSVHKYPTAAPVLKPKVFLKIAIFPIVLFQGSRSESESCSCCVIYCTVNCSLSISLPRSRSLFLSLSVALPPSLSLPLTCLGAEVGRAPPDCQCAPRDRLASRRTAPPHGSAQAHSAPGAAPAVSTRSASTGVRGERSGKSSGGAGSDRSEEVEEEDLTMASKETAAAGFANVSRELTGERGEHEVKFARR